MGTIGTLVKTGISTAAGIGGSQVAANIIKATTPKRLKQSQKIATVIGGVMLSYVANDAASAYAERIVDNVDGLVRMVKVIRRQNKRR